MSEKIKVSCLHCGTTNYFPSNPQGRRVNCGRCRHPLSPPGQVLDPLPGQAHALFQNSALPVLAAFVSQNCVHCHRMLPVLENLARRRQGEVMVIKIWLDSHPEMGGALGIRGVPTFLVIHRGAERGRISGAMPETDFALWVASLV